MSEARQTDLWDHTASIMTKIHNANCRKQDAVKDPSTFNPYRQKPGKTVSIAEFAEELGAK